MVYLPHLYRSTNVVHFCSVDTVLIMESDLAFSCGLPLTNWVSSLVTGAKIGFAYLVWSLGGSDADKPTCETVKGHAK